MFSYSFIDPIIFLKLSAFVHQASFANLTKKNLAKTLDVSSN